ncbi:MAG: hypothetical protein HWD82_10770 [Flavobacteriaceae bacterium]|nr:hypothetical protein [Flavobacteriaceae bacterium]
MIKSKPISLQLTVSKLLLLLVVFLITTAFNFQETVWLDEDLNRTTQSKAVYYRTQTKLEGNISYFYKNRIVYRKVFYKDGKLNGKFLEYYSTGELREIGSYNNGLRDGNWKEYYKNGKIKKKGKYSKGERVGVWKTFYKNVY